MLRHGNSGHSSGARSPSLTAASLIDSSLRSTAATVFASSRKDPKSIPRVNSSIMAMPSTMSRSGSAGSLKGKHGLACGLFTDRFFEHFRRREIDRNTEEIGQSILKPDHVQQRQRLRRVEVRNQVNVRRRGSFPARHGAVQAQMDNPGRLQLRLMLAQLGDDTISVHTRTLTYVRALRQL